MHAQTGFRFPGGRDVFQKHVDGKVKATDKEVPLASVPSNTTLHRPISVQHTGLKFAQGQKRTEMSE